MKKYLLEYDGLSNPTFTKKEGIMKDYIEYAMVGIMLAGLFLMFHNRLKVGPEDKSKGIGLRFIQYTVLIFAFPIIGILALEGVIRKSVV